MKHILVITGPSGVGKTKLSERFVADGWRRCVTVTTRDPRDGEMDGVDYHFVNKDTFKEELASGAFVETSEHYENYYGLRARDIRDTAAQYNTVVLLNWRGALAVQAALPNALVVFVSPPSIKALEERLGGRGDPSRLQYAQEDMSHREDFKHQVINDDFETCYQELCELVRG